MNKKSLYTADWLKRYKDPPPKSHVVKTPLKGLYISQEWKMTTWGHRYISQMKTTNAGVICSPSTNI